MFCWKYAIILIVAGASTGFGWLAATKQWKEGDRISPRKLPTIIPSINGPSYAPAGKKKPKAGDYLNP